VNGHAHGDRQQDDSQDHRFDKHESRDAHGAPEQRQRHDLRMACDGTVFAVVPDVRAEDPMRQEPLIPLFGTSDKAGCSQQEKGRGGQEWDEDAHGAYYDRGNSSGYEQPLLEG